MVPEIIVSGLLQRTELGNICMYTQNIHTSLFLYLSIWNNSKSHIFTAWRIKKCTDPLIQCHRIKDVIPTFCFSLFATPFSDREKPALIVHILFVCHVYFFFKFLIKFFVHHLFSPPQIIFKISFYIRAISPSLLKRVANVCCFCIHITFLYL